jgi:osmotically-inducible protein OsmY
MSGGLVGALGFLEFCTLTFYLSHALTLRKARPTMKSDIPLREAATKALRHQEALPGDRIKLTVSNGWIELEGTVDWEHQKRAAEHALRHLSGVRGVSNRLRVSPRVTPAEIQARIEDALRLRAEQEASQVLVELHDGKVILRGHVRSWGDRDEAERAVLAALGVTAVENCLTVVP